MLKTVKFSKSSAIYFLLVFAPIAVVLNLVGADHLILFAMAIIGLIPLAKLIGDSTEHLATHYGATLGSLLNVTFGNAAEIIISVVAINAGLIELVKASITGSILGNIMLIFGLSLIAGGVKHKEQIFNRENAGLQSSLIFLAIIGLAIPTILSATVLKPIDLVSQLKLQILSDVLAIVLICVYVAGILFTFFTHKHLFVAPGGADEVLEKDHNRWSKRKSFLILGASMVGVVAVSEILVGSVEETSKQFGFGELFVGAIIVGIVGNAA
ncbi:MAG TPA: hypothetical protein VFI64_06055, partial [Nitrososphaeraceae archaeon]|nr:hypothetical protein [Nitrososphaeraceae archaeon]